jgi:hypothetical protein
MRSKSHTPVYVFVYNKLRSFFATAACCSVMHVPWPLQELGHVTAHSAAARLHPRPSLAQGTPPLSTIVAVASRVTYSARMRRRRSRGRSRTRQSHGCKLPAHHNRRRHARAATLSSRDDAVSCRGLFSAVARAAKADDVTAHDQRRIAATITATTLSPPSPLQQCHHRLARTLFEHSTSCECRPSVVVAKPTHA